MMGQLKAGEPNLPFFTWWRTAAIKMGGNLYPLTPVSWEELQTARTQSKAKAGLDLEGFPILISGWEGLVGVYPAPIEDFEMADTDGPLSSFLVYGW